jgi:hypothetical protein
MKSRKKLASLAWMAGHVALPLFMLVGAWLILETYFRRIDTYAVTLVAALVGLGWIARKAWIRMEFSTPAESKALWIMLLSIVCLGFMVSNLFFHDPGIPGLELMILLFLGWVFRCVMEMIDFAWLTWMHGYSDPEGSEPRLDERQAAIDSRALLLGALCFAELMVIFILFVEFGFGQTWLDIGRRGGLVQCMAIILAISGIVYGFTALRYYAVDRMDDDGRFWKVLNSFLHMLPKPRDIGR